MWQYDFEQMKMDDWPDTLKGVEQWQDACRAQVAVWRSVMHQALDVQASWADSVRDSLDQVPGLPDPVAELVREALRVSGEWSRVQAGAWESWMGLLEGNARRPAVKPVAAPRPKAAAKPAPAPKAAPAPVAPAPAPKAAPTPAPKATPKAAQDDLKAISGVGPALEKKLNAAGVTSYRQVALWTEADVARMEKDVLGGNFGGRVARDDWKGQARTLHLKVHGEKL